MERERTTIPGGMEYPRKLFQSAPKYGRKPVRLQDGTECYQIVALRDFVPRLDGYEFGCRNTISRQTVHAGELGGYISDWRNLSQRDTCWIYPEGSVFDTFEVEDSSIVFGGAKCSGEGYARGNCEIKGEVCNAGLDGYITVAYFVRIDGKPQTLIYCEGSVNIVGSVIITGAVTLSGGVKIYCDRTGTPKEIADAGIYIEGNDRVYLGGRHIVVEASKGGAIRLRDCSFSGAVMLSAVTNGHISIKGGNFAGSTSISISQSHYFEYAGKDGQPASGTLNGLAVPFDEIGTPDISFDSTGVAQLLCAPSGANVSGGIITCIRNQRFVRKPDMGLFVWYWTGFGVSGYWSCDDIEKAMEDCRSSGASFLGVPIERLQLVQDFYFNLKKIWGLQ
jgi:hypothetical protein